jgi:hypothetical protein
MLLNMTNFIVKLLLHLSDYILPHLLTLNQVLYLLRLVAKWEPDGIITCGTHFTDLCMIAISNYIIILKFVPVKDDMDVNNFNPSIILLERIKVSCELTSIYCPDYNHEVFQFYPPTNNRCFPTPLLFFGSNDGTINILSLNNYKIVDSMQMLYHSDSPISNSFKLLLGKHNPILLTGTRDGLVYCHQIDYNQTDTPSPHLVQSNVYKLGTYPIIFSNTDNPASIVAICKYPFKIFLKCKRISIAPILYTEVNHAVPFNYEKNGMFFLEPSLLSYVIIANEPAYTMKSYAMSKV